jgi:hypothetical protein
MRWRNNHLLILLRNRSDTKSPFAFVRWRVKPAMATDATLVETRDTPNHDTLVPDPASRRC